MSTSLTRFAPSPTGYLHLGHARAAYMAFHFGPCLLRVEDIDHTRCKPEFEHAIYEDLTWLGFDWPAPVRVQSNHIKDYIAVIDTLTAKGLTYRCFKTRKEITQMQDNAGSFRSKTDKDEKARLAAGEAFAWRLSIPHCQHYLGPRAKTLAYKETGQGQTMVRTVDLNSLDDIVIARKDIGTSYHIAVTHDDAAQNITHVVRGADFIDQTPYHIVLQALMDWATPTYHHHDLLLRADGEKLSKRNQDTAIRTLREAGLSPSDVIALALDDREV